MKRLFAKTTLLILLIAVSTAFAQKKQTVAFVVPEMTIDEETKMVTYSGVMQERADKAELYKRGLIFFNTNYKNPTNVIKKQDEANGEIEGIARFGFKNPADKHGTKTDAGLISYTINLQIKDGRYKYVITKINWKQASYFGIEKWMDKKSPSYNANYDYYLMQADEYFKELTEKLGEAMKKSSVEEKKADW